MFSGSRPHAVRYKQEFDGQIAVRGLIDLRTLVAFSGRVDDPNLFGTSYREPEGPSYRELEIELQA